MLMSSGANVQTMRSKNFINKNTDRDSKDCHRGTKIVALHAFYYEVKWEPFETRYRQDRLLFLYKMFDNLPTEYLYSLILYTANTLSRYNLSR